jgi:hypothetical protein
MPPNVSHGTEVGLIQFCGCICPKLECMVCSLEVDATVGTGDPDCECGCERRHWGLALGGMGLIRDDVIG